jgi:hypothetical protein
MYFAGIKASDSIITLWFLFHAFPLVTAMKNRMLALNLIHTDVDDRFLQPSNNTEICNALTASAQECLLSDSSPECIDCLNNAINEINTNLDGTTCFSFETQICSAIVTCDCTACLEELELAYSCDDSCDPVDCLSPTTAPSPSGTHECYPLLTLEINADRTSVLRATGALIVRANNCLPTQNLWIAVYSKNKSVQQSSRVNARPVKTESRVHIIVETNIARSIVQILHFHPSQTKWLNAILCLKQLINVF